jgi:hypothetical protein
MRLVPTVRAGCARCIIFGACGILRGRYRRRTSTKPAISSRRITGGTSTLPSSALIPRSSGCSPNVRARTRAGARRRSSAFGRGAAQNPVRYPFRSFDGGSVIDRQRSGTRTYDINNDGVDHYGLYSDWIEDLRLVAGPQIVDDMANGAEAYLQLWARSEAAARP